MNFLILLALAIVFAVVALTRTRIKVSQFSGENWDDLVARLEPVPFNGLSIVALDYLQPTKGQIAIETNQIWELVGGSEGLRRMSTNAEVLIALAGYAQQWNRQEGVIVAERMRRDGAALRRSTRKLSLGLLLGYGGASGPFNVQEAASAYYLMRQRLLALYETSHAGRYPRLAAAL